MARIHSFINGEGSRLDCEEGSVAYDLMSKDGAFVPVGEIIEGERQGVGAVGSAKAAPPTRNELIARATELGIEKAAKTKSVDLIAAIEAAEAAANDDEADADDDEADADDDEADAEATTPPKTGGEPE